MIAASAAGATGADRLGHAHTARPRLPPYGSRHTFVALSRQSCDVYVLFRYRVLAHASAMASLRQKIAAEHSVRELLEKEGLPEPDEVEYGYGCIRLLFQEPKIALIVDIDKPEDDSDGEPDERSVDADLN
jgi:hypothetical protein